MSFQLNRQKRYLDIPEEIKFFIFYSSNTLNKQEKRYRGPTVV